MEVAARALHRQQNSLLVFAQMHDWLIRLRIATAGGSGLAQFIN